MLVKARVVSLGRPWLMVCSDGDRFEVESWSVQCEVLQSTMLGGQPPDEDAPSNNAGFFGFGQPG